MKQYKLAHEDHLATEGYPNACYVCGDNAIGIAYSPSGDSKLYRGWCGKKECTDTARYSKVFSMEFIQYDSFECYEILRKVKQNVHG